MMKRLLLLTLLVSFGLSTFSQTTWYTTEDGNWSEVTWNTLDFVPSAGTPAVGDIALILHDITVPAASTIEVAGISVGTIQDFEPWPPPGDGSLTVDGNLTLGSGGLILINGLPTGYSVPSITIATANSDATISATGILTYSGNINVNGAMNIEGECKPDLNK